MRRFFVILSLTIAATVGLCSFGARAQQITFTANCNGDATHDTLWFTDAKTTVGASNPATFRLPWKNGLVGQCKVNTLTLTINIVLDNTDGSGIFVVTGQTLTVAGPRVNPAGKVLFYNVAGGQGTVVTTGATYLNSDDASVTNTRTPTDGSVTPAKFNASAIDPAANVPGARTLGAGALQALPGNGSATPLVNAPLLETLPYSGDGSLIIGKNVKLDGSANAVLTAAGDTGGMIGTVVSGGTNTVTIAKAGKVTMTSSGGALVAGRYAQISNSIDGAITATVGYPTTGQVLGRILVGGASPVVDFYGSEIRLSQNSSSYASLAAAVTAIGSTPTDLEIVSAFPSGGTTIVPSTLRLLFTLPGSLVLGSPDTVTIRSDASGWPVQQVFSGSGTLSLSGNNVISWMLPEWFGAKADNSTDCTSAIQKILDIQSAADHDALIQFQRGVYVIAGALQDTSLSNAQIVLPKRSLTTSSIINVEFRGSGAPAHPLQGNTGTVLRSSLGSGTGNVIGVKNDQGNNSSANAVAVAFSISSYISVTFRDITVRLPSNPTNSAIDLSNVYDPTVDHVRVDTVDLAVGGLVQYINSVDGPLLGLNVAEPTTATSYGIKLPHDYHTAHVQIENATILGYYNALRFAENVEGAHITIGGSKIGLAAEGGSYPAHFVDVIVVATVANLKAIGPAAEYAGKTNVHNGLYIYIDKFKVEDFGTQLPWSTNVWDVDDATNLLKGRVNIWGGFFSEHLWPSPSPINGAANLDIGNDALANGKRVDPWVNITSNCTIAAGTGTFTSISVTVLRRVIDGTEVDLQINGTITTNGTAAGYLAITLPFAAPQHQAISGSTINVGPFGLNATVVAGSPVTNPAVIIITKADSTYFGADGVVFAASGRVKIGP